MSTCVGDFMLKLLNVLLCDIVPASFCPCSFSSGIHVKIVHFLNPNVARYLPSGYSCNNNIVYWMDSYP